MSSTTTFNSERTVNVMYKPNYYRSSISSVLSLLLLLALQPAVANEDTVSVRLAALSSWQVKNDVQIPNNTLGSRFSLQEAVGEGPINSVRFEANWMLNERHGIRVLLAPLTATETVVLDESVRFAGEQFGAGPITEATYRFNSWRFGYHYLLKHSNAGSLRVGATLKVRDAEIRLTQGDTVGLKDDLGIVPLLYVAGQYRLGNRWTIRADLDGLAGGPGRAIDLGVALDFSINKRWQIGAEFRVLEGGADAEEVYNFAQFNSASVVLSTGF